MRIHLSRKHIIDDYIAVDPKARSSCAAWPARVKHQQWNTRSDITKTFRSATFLGKRSHRVVFHIGNSKYRVICMCLFSTKYVDVIACWIGTRTEYQHLGKSDRQYLVSRR